MKREEIPSSAVPELRAGTPAHTIIRGRLDAKNLRFLLEDRQHVLPLGEDWDTDPPFNHTYRYPGAVSCRVAIGDILQYYPLYKGWAPESYTPHPDYSWFGIMVDYTVMSPGRKVVKERIDEVGKVIEVPEGAVENIGVLRLYAQAELRDIYNGNAGEDKLPYKGGNVLRELSELRTLNPRDRLLSTDIEGLKLSGVIRTVPVKDVGINTGAKGKIVLRFDLPWLTFHKAGKKRAYVSRRHVDVDLSPIQNEEAESDSD